MIEMNREKRSAHVQAKVFPSTLEKAKRRLGKVTTMSDYLFQLIERDIKSAEINDEVEQRIGSIAVQKQNIR